MQADRWLIGAKATQRRKALPGANHTTPIPARASAYPKNVVKIRPRYARINPQEQDVTRIPTFPPFAWLYETPDYDAESSLASLSLMTPETSHLSLPGSEPDIEDLDTAPPPLHSHLADTVYAQTSHHSRPRDLCELDTIPSIQHDPRGAVFLTLAEVPTFPPAPTLVPCKIPGSQESVVESSVEPWPGQKRAKPPHAQRVAHRERRPQSGRSFPLNPLDRLRWWLLYPGRIERLLWSAGALLLVSITALVSFVTAMSLGIVHPANPVRPSHTSIATVTIVCDTAAGKDETTNGRHCVVLTQPVTTSVAATPTLSSSTPTATAMPTGGAYVPPVNQSPIPVVPPSPQPVLPSPTKTHPTATPQPTATSLPTATPLPTETATPQPTATVTPLPTAVRSPTTVPSPPTPPPVITPTVASTPDVSQSQLLSLDSVSSRDVEGAVPEIWLLAILIAYLLVMLLLAVLVVVFRRKRPIL